MMNDDAKHYRGYHRATDEEVNHMKHKKEIAERSVDGKLRVRLEEDAAAQVRYFLSAARVEVPCASNCTLSKIEERCSLWLQ